MTINFDTIVFNESITDGVSNSGIPTEEESNIGIKYNSDADSQIVNKFLFNLSSAIKFIQESGSILWIKNKEYYEGSVVNIIELRGTDYNLRKFKCISKTPTTNAPLSGTINTDPDTLAIYFSTPNTVNDTEWIELIELEESELVLEVPERSKSVRLFDIPDEGFNRINFDVMVERYNTNTADFDKLKFTVEFQSNDYRADVNNAFVEILDVLCNNYERTDYVPVADSSGFIPPSEYGFVFGKSRFALLGITLHIIDNSVYLGIYSDNNSYIDDTKNITFRFNVNRTDIQLIPVIATRELNLDQNTLVIRDGYNNTGNDCGYIVESSVRYNTEEMFKRSLLVIDDSTCMNVNSVRPGYSKIFDKTFDPHNIVAYIYDSKSTDYSKHVLPKMTGFIGGQYTFGIGFVHHLNDYITDDSLFTEIGKGQPSAFTDSAYANNGISSDPATKINNNTYCIVTHGDFDSNIFNSKNPELNVYSNNPTLYPKSKRVYKYFKY